MAEGISLERFELAFKITFSVSACAQLLLFIYALAWCYRNPTPHTKKLASIWLCYSIAHMGVGTFG